MDKVIVTTTINPPTEALRKFAQMEDWHLVVVGDLKTPHTAYADLDCTYVSPKDQEGLYPTLSDAIGWNCIQRRNLGFLVALSLGAEVIASVDDDNVPMPSWGKNVRLGTQVLATLYPANEKGWFDPVFAAGPRNLWHRGYPIQFLTARTDTSMQGTIVPDVQANFWNGDPDIDAICRMEHAPDVVFSPERFPFWSTGMTPFNSQNTLLTREALKNYFMFPGIGRMDDIWASFFMVASGYKVLFDEATVFQDRNPHDLTLDFKAELLGYENNYLMVNALRESPENIRKFLPEPSWRSFSIYREIAAGL